MTLAAALLLTLVARAETVALWLFDEPVGAEPGSVLGDVGPNSYALTLGRGGEIVAGKFGHGLRPVRVSPPHAVAIFETGRLEGKGGRWANPMDTRLNLGAEDWTIECWLRLDPDAAGEGVVYEIGTRLAADSEPVIRFSVLSRENAFAFAGPTVGPGEGRIGMKRVEFANPEGPPGGVAVMQTTTLALTGGKLPRDAWFHVALVHIAAADELRLFLNGVRGAVAAMKTLPLPHGDDAAVSLGADRHGQLPLRGAMDEMRISDAAIYREDFAPPGSFSRSSSELSNSSNPASTRE